MRKILLSVLLMGSCVAYGQEEMHFVTVIASPWGVASSLHVSGVDDDIRVPAIFPQVATLNFVSFGVGGHIRLANSNLGVVSLRSNATLSDNGDMTWELDERAAITVTNTGMVGVKTYNDGTMTFKNTPALLAVQPVDEENTTSTGTLTFGSSDGGIAVLSAMKVEIDENEWYDYSMNENAVSAQPKAEMYWAPCASSGKDVTCEGPVFSSSELADGDYVLISK